MPLFNKVLISPIILTGLPSNMDESALSQSFFSSLVFARAASCIETACIYLFILIENSTTNICHFFLFQIFPKNWFECTWDSWFSPHVRYDDNSQYSYAKDLQSNTSMRKYLENNQQCINERNKQRHQLKARGKKKFLR